MGFKNDYFQLALEGGDVVNLDIGVENQHSLWERSGTGAVSTYKQELPQYVWSCDQQEPQLTGPAA